MSTISSPPSSSTYKSQSSLSWKPHPSTQRNSSIFNCFTPSVFVPIGGDEMSEIQDLKSLFSTSERDFLVRSNGDRVGIDSLQGKKIGLYFSASGSSESVQFTKTLINVYQELLPQDCLEIIFCSADNDDSDGPLDAYFSEMPWLAVPFSDQETRDRLHALFKVDVIPRLVILDEDGTILNDSATEMIMKYGSEGYPFAKEVRDELEEFEAARKEQSLRSILVSPLHDFVVSAGGKKVPVSELEGKVVGLYFADISTTCYGFTPKLAEVYEKLKGRGESFEIVMVSLHYDEDWFNELFANMPWLSLPYEYKSCAKLARYFKISSVPNLVIIGPEGQTVHSGSDVVGAIEEYGAAAYPFTPEKLADLNEAKVTQTIESLLVLDDRDFVIRKDGQEVPVSDLVGKSILLYFSDLEGFLCLGFTYNLAEAYDKIKEMDETVEIIFISSDKDQASFDQHFSEMPWLAVPFGDKREAWLRDWFNVNSTPRLVSIGSDGKTIEASAQDVFSIYGPDAYPFSAKPEREAGMEEDWPERIEEHPLHEKHVLLLDRSNGYTCEACGEEGSIWAYKCIFCGFYLHLKCALKPETGDKDGVNEEEHD